MDFDTVFKFSVLIFLLGIAVYSEIMNRKQRKQVEEWRKSWF